MRLRPGSRFLLRLVLSYAAVAFTTIALIGVGIFWIFVSRYNQEIEALETKIVEHTADAAREFIPQQELIIGRCNGSLGEMAVLFLLIGGVFLLLTKVITWHIPVSCLAAIALFGALFGFGEFDLQGATFHLFSGAAVFGAFFIATDYVTSPLHPVGKLIFGAGVGILTMVIRLWAGYPEGVSFAVLLMNATVPILDRYTKPKKFGFRKLAEEGGK